MGFFGCIPRFIKDHAGWILTGLGSAGLVWTAVLTAKEAPVAKDKIEEAKNDDPELTLWEKIKIATPIYIPAILTGAGSLGCFWGSQIFNVKVQAGLVTAYGALAMQFDQYRGAIRDEYGEEADKKALAAANIEIRKLREANAMLLAEQHQLFGFAWLPGVVIEANPADIQLAFMRWNRNLTLRGWNDLQELNEFLDIPKMCYDEEEYAKYGCNQYENETTWGQGCVDFGFVDVETKHGTIHVAGWSMLIPYRMDIDYGFQGSSSDEQNLCPLYNMPLALERTKQIGANDIIETAHPSAYCPVYCLG